MIYISVEKLVAINYPAKRFTLRKKKYQILYFILVAILFGIINVPSLLFYEIKSYKIPNNMSEPTVIKYCYYADTFSYKLLSMMFSVNRVIIPFSLMIICSILLIVSVFKMRKRIIQNFLSNNQQTNERNNRYKRDIRLAVTTLLLNIIYLVLNAPLAIFLNLTNSVQQDLYGLWIVVNICFLSFGINFYLILASNHLTRKEFLSFFKKIKL